MSRCLRTVRARRTARGARRRWYGGHGKSKSAVGISGSHAEMARRPRATRQTPDPRPLPRTSATASREPAAGRRYVASALPGAQATPARRSLARSRDDLGVALRWCAVCESFARGAGGGGGAGTAVAGRRNPRSEYLAPRQSLRARVARPPVDRGLPDAEIPDPSLARSATTAGAPAAGRRYVASASTGAQATPARRSLAGPASTSCYARRPARLRQRQARRAAQPGNLATPLAGRRQRRRAVGRSVGRDGDHATARRCADAPSALRSVFGVHRRWPTGDVRTRDGRAEAAPPRERWR
ncbi:hypothetical protein PsYK624_171830 [Phanerochaete sordida]|uniref:Uncharacterized protein n=1 Tax=Phanerochaete sordida TaxID=48140 RepID=A0A9P3GS52_9APHY|nr:hypothetical protein PsYK624_171830 [Phanerochaete sordida]